MITLKIEKRIFVDNIEKLPGATIEKSRHWIDKKKKEMAEKKLKFDDFFTPVKFEKKI